MAVNGLDTEQLIAEVQLRPELWDLFSVEYKNREAKPRIWMEVTERLVYGFNDMEEDERLHWIDKVQKRWKATRDAYIRKIRTNQTLPEKKRTEYIFHDKLKFLEKTLDKTPEMILGISEETRSGDEDISIREDARAYSISTLESTSNRVVLPKRYTESTKRKREPPTAFEEELISLLKSNSRREDNGDRSYLLSLLPLIENMTEEQKIAFRVEVMKIIMKIKKLEATVTPSAPPKPVHYQLVPVTNGSSNAYPQNPGPQILMLPSQFNQLVQNSSTTTESTNSSTDTEKRKH